MANDKQEDPVFRTGEAHRLLEGSGQDLTDDERVLLLALVSMDAETGKSLSEKELAALEKLKTQVESYDTDELTQAVKHLVTAKPREDQKLEWSELKRRRAERRSSGE